MKRAISSKILHLHKCTLMLVVAGEKKHLNLGDHQHLNLVMYSTSSIIRTLFIRHSIIRPLGQIIIYDITNTFPVNVGQ